MISLIQKNKLFSMKLIKATALTVSCMVSLPGFSQTNYQCVTGTIGSNGNVGWSNTYCFPISGSNGTNPAPYSFGIQDSAADNNNSGYPPPPACTSSEITNLRTKKMNTPGCYGDPGYTFDVYSWEQNVGLTIWEWLNAPIGVLYNGIWTDASPSMVALVNLFVGNNADLYASYDPFADSLYTACQVNHPANSDWDGLNNCLTAAYYLLDNYAPGTNMIMELVNWASGMNFNATDYNTSWAGRLSRDVTNHYICHDIYQQWANDDCSGIL